MKRSDVLVVSSLAISLAIGSITTGIESLQEQENSGWQSIISSENSTPRESKRMGGLPETNREVLTFPEEIATPDMGNPPSILSDTTFLTLPPGSCSTVAVLCSIPDFPPVADILIDFDLTGSMGEELDSLKSNSIGIMNAIRAEIPNSDFGLISAEDYFGFFMDSPPGFNCGYSSLYGSAGKPDSPYRLDISLTTGINAVADAINAMTLGNGQDASEDYTRQLYESFAELAGDTNQTYGPIGWRTEAKKIVLAFNDSVPHDCNVMACVGGSPWSFGRDPGRDERLLTSDDLVHMDVLNQMASYNVSLVDVYSGDSFTKLLWDCWTEITPGGGAFLINPDGSIPDGVSIDSFIVSLIRATFDTVETVMAEVCAGDPTFLSSVSPPSYEDVESPSIVSFDLEFCVPSGTPSGTYCLDVCIYGENLLLCTYTFCINVPLDSLGVEEESRKWQDHPLEFKLFESLPNPFHTSTQIRYEIPKWIGATQEGGTVPVRLEIFDITGRLVETLVNTSQESGVYQIYWDSSRTGGSSIPSGIYFYRLLVRFGQTNKFVDTKKFILISN